MSVLTYLSKLSTAITIADWERDNIDTSIGTLSRKLNLYFDNIETKFVFGSYDRKTILRRSKDSNSDVDFMVCFSDGSEFTPQTLMNRLKRFANDNYSKNEIYQSSPTIVLELSHIKFELVPSYKSWLGGYRIPAPSSEYTTWVDTYPHSLKTKLEEKNRNNNYQIRKLVRLLKYWNVQNQKVYSSYQLEKHCIDLYYFYCTNLKDYFFDAIDSLPTSGLPQYKKNKVERLKTIIKDTKEFEKKGFNTLAEYEIKKAFE